MRKILELAAVLWVSLLSQSYAQLVIGQVNVTETAHDMLLHSSGAFVLSGSEANAGALYKVACEGPVLARLIKSYSPGPTTLHEAVELPDGSIVAVGETRLMVGDTSRLHLVLLKTNPNLQETASRTIQIAQKNTRGRSVALAPNGDLLVLGDVEGAGLDFWDVFLWRVRASDLTPMGTPTLYNFGVDFAHSLRPAGHGEYLLSMTALSGNLFHPEAVVFNRLMALKIDEQGQLQWKYVYEYSRQAKYGFCQAGGAVRGFSPASENLVLCGALHTPASPDSLTDAVFLLLSPAGQPLDTLIFPLPGRQVLANLMGSEAQPERFVAVGYTAQASGPATAHAAGVVAFNHRLFAALTLNETALPIALQDIQEVPYGRYAFLGTFPEFFFLPTRDIILITPSVEDVHLLYQNCVLSASFSVPDPVYQWYRDSLPIPGATQGVYRPMQAGNYYVKITDAFGCSGFSDSLYLSWPKAGFVWNATGGMVSFTNTSSDADTYWWDFGDGTTSTQPHPTHTYPVSGQYVVTLVARTACGADTTRQTLGVVGVREAQESSFLIGLSPNPNAGTFLLALSGDLRGEVLYTLLSTDGRLLDYHKIEVTESPWQCLFSYAYLSPGLYTVLIQTQRAVRAVRLKVE